MKHRRNTFVRFRKGGTFVQSLCGTLVGGGIIVALLIAAATFFGGEEGGAGGEGGRITTQQAAELIAQGLNESIKDNPHNGLFTAIEQAHVSVTAKSGRVTGCRIQTIDGGNYVNEDGGNISSIWIQFTVTWDGVLHKNGRTVLEMILSGDGNITDAKITATDAMVNITDPDWWKAAGELLGTVLSEL